MRLLVDAGLCQGHAMCEVEAPDVFAVPKVGPVVVTGVVTSVVNGEITDLEAVRSAVRHCPTGALTLVED